MKEGFQEESDSQVGFEGYCMNHWQISGLDRREGYSTWEPEEHILDPRLVLAYEENGPTKLSPCLCLSSVAVVGGDPTEGGPPWIPTHPPSEVTVTDITANSITVTFREAQAAEGFFRDRSGHF
ncbi:chromobox protein homolog 7 [Gracilinanus agilis]|uniref:chromobox protein homolog 7 n=1 Tax=Gracilinanus agilis TaxID=191870 RepID=UPI001CFCB2FB|nr:chromobox protein homolog 7 [Gracilinanus agilis]